jgi:MFS family permease
MANSLRQRLSPRDLMGRVGSAWRGIVWGAFPIGSLIGGALAEKWGVRLPLYIAGIAQCIAAVALAGPLTRSLAASERAEALAETEAEQALTTSVNDHPLSAPASSGQAISTTLERNSPLPAGRRLHSRGGHGPLFWGRSPRNWRR